MIRIGISGAAGTGKTSTARALASQCRSIDGLNRIELISEYARHYINKYGQIDFIWEQYIIFENQFDRERSVDNGQVDVLITDCPIQLSYAYALELRGKTEIPPKKEAMILNEMYKKLNLINYSSCYDFIFHLPPILKSIDDGVRIKKHLTQEWKEEMNNSLLSIFNIFPPKKFLMIESEDLQERVDFCLSKIKQYKYE